MNTMIEIKNKYIHDPYQILEHPNIGMCLFYPNGKILFVNEKFAAIHELQVDELQDRRIQEFCHYTVQHLANFLKSIVNHLPVDPQEMYAKGRYYLYQIQGIYKNNRLVLIVSLIDITSYKRLELAAQQSIKQLEKNHLIDRITGLNNYSAFDAKIHEIYQESIEASVGMLLVDMDHFRVFTQEKDVEVGISILKKIAMSLNTFTQSNPNTLFYLGGNEFIFIVPNVQDWNLYTLAEQVRCEIFNLNIYFNQGIEYRLTCSLALRRFVTGSNFDINFFLVKLKQLMLQAKSAGGNCWIEPEPSMSS